MTDGFNAEEWGIGMKLLAVSMVIALIGLQTVAAASDPWTDADLIQPKQLAERIADKNAKQPTILYVGFGVLYRSRHVAGAKFAGPCSKPEGLELLKRAVASLSHDDEIVIYCGCCPFVRCPNIRPAFRALREMGFHNVKVVPMPTNFHDDWDAKGYPTDSVNR